MPKPRKSQPGNACPLRYALDLIGGKWKLAIICLILPGTRRYGELKRKLGAITNMMLAQSLKELEADRLVRRKQYNTIPPKVEYSLTDDGRSLYEALHSFAHWGIDHMEKRGKPSPRCAECLDGAELAMHDPA